jgi:parvulin-like peptidyl-prolyl isomerase
MRKIICLQLLSLAFLLTISGCGKEESGEGLDKVIAVVNDTKITEEELAFRLRGSHGREPSPELRKVALQDLVDRELLYQQGMALNLDKDKEYQTAINRMAFSMEQFKRSEMARRVYNKEIAAKVEVSEEEAKKNYDENLEKIKTELHLAQMGFMDESKAKKALENLTAGASFEALAKQGVGKLPSKRKNAWDLGFLKWNQIPKDWQETVYGLKPGEVSGLIGGDKKRTRIIKVIAKRKASETDFEKVKGAITNRLRDQKVKDAYKKYIENLKSSGKVKIY